MDGNEQTLSAAHDTGAFNLGASKLGKSKHALASKTTDVCTTTGPYFVFVVVPYKISSNIRYRLALKHKLACAYLLGNHTSALSLTGWDIRQCPVESNSLQMRMVKIMAPKRASPNKKKTQSGLPPLPLLAKLYRCVGCK